MKRKNGSQGLANPSTSGGCEVAFSLIRTTVICCGIALFLVGTAVAKKKPLTKTIQGEVVDKDNNPIVGASVELTDTTTGKTLGIYTEAGGHYHFTNLKPSHDYQVRATYRGEQSEERHVSSLDEEGVRVVNLTIPPLPTQ